LITQSSRYDMHSRNMLVIYTPTYYKSTGLQYRLSMLMKTLRENGYKVYLHVDEHETLIRGVYTVFAKHLLRYEYTWRFIGERVASKVLKYNPDVTFLTIDTTAGAIPLLKSRNVRTVLLLEDLTVDWLQISGKTREIILKHLSEYVSQADLVVVPGNSFKEKVRSELGVDPVVCPPGLELNVTLEEALSRPLDKIHVLHARQIVHPVEAKLLELIAEQMPEDDRYVLHALKAGKYYSKAKSKKIRWYHYPSLEDAIKRLRKYHVGLIATPRTAPTFTSYWFHLSLLQPLITITPKPIEVRGCIHVPLGEFLENPSRWVMKSLIDDVASRYSDMIKSLYESAAMLERSNVHKELISALERIT